MNELDPVISGGADLGLIGTVTSVMTGFVAAVYLAWRKFQKDDRESTSGNLQLDLFAQLQAAADQHLKAVKELQTLLDNERSYSSTLLKRNADLLTNWAEERKLWEQERKVLMDEVHEARMRGQALNSDLDRATSQLAQITTTLARIQATHPDGVIEGEN